MRKLFARAYNLLSDSDKRKIVPLVLLLAMGSLLDFFSLASFLPVIILTITAQQALPYSWLGNMYNVTGLHDPVNVAIGLTVFALLFILIKTQIQVWITFRKASYAYSVGADIASRSLTSYLNISYIQFSQSDYTREINRISNLPLTFANNIVIPFGTILSESVVSILLLICLVWYDFTIFIFISILLAPLLILYRTKQKKIKQISQQLKTKIPLLLKQALQTVESLLEIRIQRKEAYFKNKFNTTFHQLEKIFATDHTNNTSATRATELVAALCIGVLLLYTLISHQSFSDTVILLTLYAGASFRIIPSVNRIFVSLLQIRTNEYALQELQNAVADYEGVYKEEGDPLRFNDTIEIRRLHFGYPERPFVLKDISLTIARYEKILLTGKSGSGKTSMLLILLRFVKEQSGGIYIDGQKLETENTLMWQKLLGYVPQNPALLDASIAENIAFGIPADQINYPQVSELIIQLDLQEWVISLPDGLHSIIGEKGTKISGGQRQRLAIARTLYHGAEILLLDEITNQLDSKTRSEIMNIVHTGILKDKTIIMVSHNVEETNLFDSVYELRDGSFASIYRKEKAKV